MGLNRDWDAHQKFLGGQQRRPQQNHIHTKSYASLIECIEFHKRMFLTMDAAEKLR